MDGQFVAYYRVSTKRQGESGLGLDAQKRAVADFLNGGSWNLIGEFEEVESGRRSDRPALSIAIEKCKLTGAKLLIAKLDRLSRDVHFLTGLEKEGVDFLACDMPTANKLTVHIMAAVAQQEREQISSRTKAALASVKARLEAGEAYVSKRSKKRVHRLGSPALPVNRDPAKATQALRAKAQEFSNRVRPTAAALRASGLSFQQIANRLNELKVRTPRGASWTAMGVKRVLDRS
jgi:DNA invertase Pin-like site-specific DNA recombinase